MNIAQHHQARMSQTWEWTSFQVDQRQMQEALRPKVTWLHEREGTMNSAIVSLAHKLVCMRLDGTSHFRFAPILLSCDIVVQTA